MSYSKLAERYFLLSDYVTPAQQNKDDVVDVDERYSSCSFLSRRQNVVWTLDEAENNSHCS